MLIHFKEGFRSFHTSIIRFFGQRAAKILVVKFGPPILISDVLKQKPMAMASVLGYVILAQSNLYYIVFM